MSHSTQHVLQNAAFRCGEVRFRGVSPPKSRPTFSIYFLVVEEHIVVAVVQVVVVLTLCFDRHGLLI